MKNALIVLVSLLTLAGCGGGGGGGTTATPSTPASVDVTGLWIGTLSSNQFGAMYTNITMAQNSSGGVSGTYTTPSGGGTAAGSVSGSSIDFTLSPTGCTGYLVGTGTVATNSTGKPQITATYSGSYNCGGQAINESGNISVSKN